MLFITPDPLINSLREIIKKKVGKFPVEVLKLLTISPDEKPQLLLATFLRMKRILLKILEIAIENPILYYTINT